MVCILQNLFRKGKVRFDRYSERHGCGCPLFMWADDTVCELHLSCSVLALVQIP